MEKIAIGRILKPHGLRGDLKVELFKFEEDKFDRDISYYLEGEDKNFRIIRHRLSDKFFYIAFEDYEDINKVERFKGKYLYIEQEDLKKLADGEYYIKDLIGLKVVDEEGKDLGNIDDVLTDYPNEIYVVSNHLIPAIKDYVLEINLQEKYVRISKKVLQ